MFSYIPCDARYRLLVKDIRLEQCSFIHLLIDWSWMQMSMLLNYPWSTLLVWPTSWKVFWTRWTTYANAQHHVVMVSNVIQTLKLNFLLSEKCLCYIGMKKLIWHWIVFVVLFFITSFIFRPYTTVSISACTANPINFYFDIGYTLCDLLLKKFSFSQGPHFSRTYHLLLFFCFCFFVFSGILVPTGMEDNGLGGAITVRIACSSCGNSLHYPYEILWPDWTKIRP